MNTSYKKCNICPRKCLVDREKDIGYCGCTDKVKIARASRHMWEEPCISGENGSGTVFFSGCNLKCIYCQNWDISDGNCGFELDEEELERLFLSINSSGVHNINLVTATHYLPTIIKVLKKIKPNLNIPVVYNCSGYENPDLLNECKGIIDIFLTDIKYKSTIISSKYSKCADYFEVCIKCIAKMLEIAGAPIIENGIMKSGVIIRHLILPSHKNDSIDILRSIYELFGNEDFYFSLMSQYTPIQRCNAYPEINRKLTSLEYKRVTEEYERLGFMGYLQENSSSSDNYIPDFTDKGEFLSPFIK